MQDFEFSSFKEWLRKGLKPNTVNLYFSLVHACLHDNATVRSLLCEEGALVEHILEFDTRLSDVSRGTSRAALRSLARYLDTQLGVSIRLHFLDHRTLRKRTPNPLAPLMYELRKYIQLSRLQFIRWENVKGTGGTYAAITDPIRRNEYEVPIELMRTLNLMAGGGERAKPGQPIIPIEPKAMRHMPTLRIQRLAASALDD